MMQTSPLYSRTPLHGHKLVPQRMLRKDAGFSLIELMVAIGMALFLAAGLISTVFTMKGTFTTQDQMTQLQENQRFLLTAMNNTIHNAGYFTTTISMDRTQAFPQAAGTTPDNTTYGIAQFVTGTSGAGTTGDTLDIRFQTTGGDSLTDCQGLSNTSGAGVTEIWSNSFSVNALNQLTCAVGVNGAAPTTATPTVLADNVASLKVLYGVDSNGTGSVDTYMQAGNVEAAGKWLNIRSVQLSITFLDPVNSKPGKPVSLPQPLIHTIALMNL